MGSVWREMEIESLGINGEGKCGETCRGEVYGGIQMGSVGRNGNGKCREKWKWEVCGERWRRKVWG